MKVVVNGSKTRFWDDVWIRSLLLFVPFERLFLVFKQKYQVVGRMGNIMGERLGLRFQLEATCLFGRLCF